MALIDLHRVSRGVNTYAGRDACIRVTCYFFLFVYGLLRDIDSNTPPHVDKHGQFRALLVEYLLYFVAIESLPGLAHASMVLSKQFATARLIARFFDNIPAALNFYKHFRQHSKENDAKPDKKKVTLNRFISLKKSWRF
jgi:hypothetical protein